MTLLPANPHVTAGTRRAGALEIIDLQHARLQASIAVQGAQLLSFRPQGDRDWLWLSPTAHMDSGKAIRGGIPLCWPWFGPAATPGLPAHGFARTRAWQPAGIDADADGVRLRFTLADDEHTRALWPYRFLATLEWQLGASLGARFTVENRDTRPFTHSWALHSYFAVADIGAVRVQGLAGSRCTDQLAATGSNAGITPAGDIRFNAEHDRIHNGVAGTVRLCDDAAGDALHIDGEHCASVVVWNPWQDKAARLADMPPGDFRRFLCIEHGNVGSDARVLAPGQRDTASLHITRSAT